ncbi:MAG: type II secretion system F family protein [Actinomycetota bacterium]|nr:type II secretion system F family protein [Actinomycetota bacterium]
MTTTADRVAGLRELATLLRAGLSLGEGLDEWADRAPESLRGPLERLRRRLRLGATTEEALERLVPELGEEGPAVAALVSVHVRLGGDAATLLEDAATAAEERRAAIESAAAAASGARLSGHMVAALPFALLLLSPASRAPLFDGTGLALLAVGVGLGAVGLVWMGRVVPRPEGLGDPCASLASLVAGVCEAGTSPNEALEVIAGCAGVPLEEELGRARRLASLGASWPEALRRAGDDGLGELATVIERATNSGSPVAAPLRSLATSRRRQAARDFEARLRRAPVIMVVPLTLCVLPSFAVLGLAPFLRGVSL